MNPSKSLYNYHAKNILLVRSKLFSSLEETSPKMTIAAKNILAVKLKTSESDSLPRMFELFPWILADLSGLNKKKCQNISISWLSIYLYIIFLDDHLDVKTDLKPEEFIGTSLLAQKGLLSLFKIVNGTKYEKVFNKSLMSSASGQLTDVLEKAVICNNEIDKVHSASGKNSILIACAGAIAASGSKKSDFIIALTQKLLLSIQLLDDLADFEQDFKQGNITILLNETAKKLGVTQVPIERKTLLEEIVLSNALLNVLKVVEQSLKAAMILISKNSPAKKGKNPSRVFFQELQSETSIFIEFLVQCGGFESYTNEEKEAVLDKVDKYIKKIYLHT
nr:hypothetical protein [uncultured Mucilaginibacter sp.]